MKTDTISKMSFDREVDSLPDDDMADELEVEPELVGDDPRGLFGPKTAPVPVGFEMKGGLGLEMGVGRLAYTVGGLGLEMGVGRLAYPVGGLGMETTGV